MKQVIDDHGYTERRACRLIGVDRTAFQYRPRRPDDAGVRERLRELANERRRFGYRRLALMLKRDGLRMNLKKVYRLYKEERLTVRKRGGRKRALGTRAPMTIPQSANQRGVRGLDRLCLRRGPPAMIVSDNVLWQEAAGGFGQ